MINRRRFGLSAAFTIAAALAAKQLEAAEPAATIRYIPKQFLEELKYGRWLICTVEGIDVRVTSCRPSVDWNGQTVGELLNAGPTPGDIKDIEWHDDALTKALKEWRGA